MAESKVVVPESVLKKIKRQEEWTLAKKEEAVAAKKKSVETWKLIFKRVEQYAKEYAEKDNELIRLKRESKLKGGFYVDPEAKLLFIIRIRGINAIDPKTKKILQLLRLRQIFNGVFLKVNKATVNMLRRVEPDVTYGYPNLKIVKELIYKRGYRKLNHERIALTDNSIVDQALGKQNGKYAEDAEDDKTKAIFGHRDFSSLKKLSVLQHQVPEPIYDVKQLIIVGRYNGRFSGVMLLEIFVG